MIYGREYVLEQISILCAFKYGSNYLNHLDLIIETTLFFFLLVQ